MQGEKAGAVVTDPPYSVDYSISFSKAEGGKDPGLQSEYKESDVSISDQFLPLLPSSFLIMTYPIDRHFFELAEALRESGFVTISELIWLKSSASFHPGQTYQQKHEPILICKKQGEKYKNETPADANTIIEFE